MGRKLLIIISLLSGIAAAADSADWSQLAETDLRAVHSAVDEHHPGPLDRLNSDFRNWQERGLAQALNLAKRATNAGGYEYAVRYYVNGFQDGHLSIAFDEQTDTHLWPGFIIALREDKFIVHSVTDNPELFKNLPPPTAQLLACDGTPVRALLEQNVMPYTGKAFLPSDWLRLAPQLLMDSGNPFIERPRECRFRYKGRTFKQMLDWQPATTDAVSEKLARAGLGKRGSVSLKRLEDGGMWVQLPSFNMSGAHADDMEKVIDELSWHRAAPYIIVDVRGNGGGSSHWALHFVKRLYGDAYADYIQTMAETTGSYTEYRVSPENVAHFESMLPGMRERAGENSDFYRYFKKVAQGMRTALENGEAFYRDHDPSKNTTITDVEKPKSEYAGMLYFLTDGYCASACLDFADVAHMLPDMIHVGQHTSADTVYMEVRSIPLPSGRGRLNIATKVIRDRPRGHNEYYTPRHIYTGDIWNTEKVAEWLMGIIHGRKKPAPIKTKS